MAFSYLNNDNIFDKYTDAKEWTEKLTVGFDEFDRIAQNSPPEMDGRFPGVTDGTAASIIRKTPRRVIQQTPTGQLFSDNPNDWLLHFAGYVLSQKILPSIDKEYSLHQKAILAEEHAMTVGAQASLVQFLYRKGEFTADFELPFWGDIFIAPGSKSGQDAPYLFIRSWWQEADVDARIAAEEEKQKSAKKRGEKHESLWDLDALKQIRKAITKKDDKAETTAEKEKSLDASGIQIVTGYQRGLKAKFITFEPTQKKILRTKENRDPRGVMPLDWLYYEIDGSNPFGRSLMSLIGSNQNVIDMGKNLWLYMSFLSANPSVQIYGDDKFDLRQLEDYYTPNAVIMMGDPQDGAKIQPNNPNTGFIDRYSDTYAMQKSQILSLVPTPDSSISASVGNPEMSRTPAGIKMNRDNVSVDDNNMRKNFEAWFSSVCETLINVWFGEQEGVKTFRLDPKTAEKIRDLVKKGKLVQRVDSKNGESSWQPVPEDFISDQDEIRVDFSTATEALRFEVDAGTSKLSSDSDQQDALISLGEKMNSILPALQQFGVPVAEKYMEYFNKLVDTSGINDPEDLKFSDEDVDKVREQAATESPDEHDKIVAYLRESGVPEEIIAQAFEMQNRGVSAEDVYSQLLAQYLEVNEQAQGGN